MPNEPSKNCPGGKAQPRIAGGHLIAAASEHARAEVTAILVDLEADGRELYDIFTAPLCKECGQKK